MPSQLNATFNQTVIEGASSTYKVIGPYEIMQKTPVEGGTLVRHYNFKSDRNSVDAYLVNGNGKSKFLGTKDIPNMQLSPQEAQDIGNALARASDRMAI